MCMNKKIIKILALLLIFLITFTFSIVFATEEALYVWSSETEPLTIDTNAKDNSNSNKNTKLIRINKDYPRNNT